MSDIIATTLDADGVLLATIDMPGRTMNVFSVELMDALDALIERAERDAAVRAIVVTSGKATFLAGADLVMVRGYTRAARSADHAAMFAMCGRLGRQFVRIEASSKPWVAAVNGIALGGGLELALACRVRIVADDPRIQLGVPEVRWGLLPGAGGTQRLPRLAGCDPALDLLLSGRSIDPSTSVRLGIFAAAVPATSLLKDAKAIARSLRETAYDVNAKFRHLAQTDVSAWSETSAREAARRHGVDDEMFARYPAHSAIVDAVLKGARRPLAEANDVEMEQFLRLMFSPVAARMVNTLFLERLRAERELAPPAGAAIEALATGAMGAANAAWSEALARTKLPLAGNAALLADTVELVGRDGTRTRLRLATSDAATAPSTYAAPARDRVAHAGPGQRAPGPARAAAAIAGADCRRRGDRARRRRSGVPRHGGVPGRRHAGVERRPADLGVVGARRARADLRRRHARRLGSPRARARACPRMNRAA